MEDATPTIPVVAPAGDCLHNTQTHDAEPDQGSAVFACPAYEHITATDLREHLPEVVNRVAFGGSRLVVTRHGSPLLAVVSMADYHAIETHEAQAGGAR